MSPYDLFKMKNGHEVHKLWIHNNVQVLNYLLFKKKLYLGNRHHKSYKIDKSDQTDFASFSGYRLGHNL